MSLSLGAVSLLASNVVGHGICIRPDPRGALLLAAAGLLFFALAQSRAYRWREKFLRLLQLVLALGAFSIVAALITGDLQEFHRLASQDWGAVPPPQLIFASIYAMASLAALLGISVKARQRLTTTEPLAGD
jgi:hypothetical protein